MPDIDNDLFELLSLVGFALIVIVGLALLGAVGRLRKSIDRTLAEWGRETAETAWRGAGPATREVAAGSSAGSLAAAEAEMPNAAAAEEPAPVEASAGPGVVPAAEEAERPQPEPVVAAEPVAAAEPGPEPQPVETPQPEPEPVAAAESEPEGQPFERDGRWWFRRGDELLVYDEMSGQWQPAPQQTTTTAAQEVPATEGDVGLGAQAPVEGAQPGAFWKCPSCGAVNGSTAESCRMCFTPRPLPTD
jgi:hypothetical protein